VGATHIVGVGSGVALDLSKALHQRMQHSSGDNQDDLRLTLVPGTLGACCASVTNQSLLLDVDEEALIIAEDGKIGTGIRSVVVDDNVMAIPSWVSGGPTNIATVSDAALASIVIALDSLLDVDCNGEGEKWELITKTLYHSQLVLESFLEESTNSSDKESKALTLKNSDKANAIQAMLCSGQLLSNGMENEREYAHSIRRSIPLALSSALLPRYFPHGNWLTFTASLLPGILQSTKMETQNLPSSEIISSGIDTVTQLLDDESLPKIIPTISSLVEGTPDPRELLNAVENNGALWNCEDVDRVLLEHVLCKSLSH
jgi:hypothetical protein